MSRPRASDIQPRDGWADHPQGRIFAREWSLPGAGAHRPASPIVLFHDSLGCVELWRDFPAELSAASGRRVIAYDRLGFGRSDAREVLPELDFIAEEARVYFPAVREQLGLERFVVFGHSVGGGMAVNCAAHHGAACVALITESAQAFVEDRTVEGLEDARALFKDPGQVDRLKRYHGDKARWVLDAWIESWLAPAFATWSLRPVLPQVDCPALVIHGVDDEYGSPVHPALIAELSGGLARLELMADTRHVPHREREADVVAMVRAFLETLP